MEQTGMEWTGMEWTGMEWTGMEWTGMEWTGSITLFCGTELVYMHISNVLSEFGTLKL